MENLSDNANNFEVLDDEDEKMENYSHFRLMYLGEKIGRSEVFKGSMGYTLVAFVIEEKYRSRGIGTELYKLLEKKLISELSIKSIHLSSSRKSFIFWTKRGYRKTDDTHMDLIPMGKKF